jgi:hypothetical protein
MGLEAWIEHVRATARKNNTTYMCAIPEAARTYKNKHIKPMVSQSVREKFLAKKEALKKTRQTALNKMVVNHQKVVNNVNRQNTLSKMLDKKKSNINRNRTLKLN